MWWELEGPQVPLRPDCLAIVNNFAFLLGGEELGPDGEFHASSKVYRYDPRQNSWLRMADMSVPRLEEPVTHPHASDHTNKIRFMWLPGAFASVLLHSLKMRKVIQRQRNSMT